MTEDQIEEQEKAPLLDHLIELRNRLMWATGAVLIAFVGCYAVSDEIFQFLVEPLKEVLGEDRRLIYTGLTEAFFTYIKVSFFAGLFVAFPVVALQFWKFLAPGLYKNERHAFLPFLVATPFLFFLGGALAYYFVFPLAWKFFVGFETAGGAGQIAIQLEAKVDQYLSLVIKMIFAFGLAFQLPVALSLLARAGLVTSKSMAQKRKFAIVFAFVAAALLTPPDIISQLSLGVPIILLYEISIVLARMIEKKRAAKEAELDALAAAGEEEDEDA